MRVPAFQSHGKTRRQVHTAKIVRGTNVRDFRALATINESDFGREPPGLQFKTILHVLATITGSDFGRKPLGVQFKAIFRVFTTITGSEFGREPPGSRSRRFSVCARH